MTMATKIQELKEQIERSKQALTAYEEKNREILTRLQAAEENLKTVKTEKARVYAAYHNPDYDKGNDPKKLRSQFADVEKREKGAEAALELVKAESAAHRFIGTSTGEIQAKIWEQHYFAFREELAPTLREELLRAFALYRLAHGNRHFGPFINDFFQVNFIETGFAFDKECTALADVIRREEAVAP